MEIFQNTPNKYVLIKQILKLLLRVNQCDTKFSDDIRYQLNYRMLEICEQLMPDDSEETANDYHRIKNKGYELVHSKLQFSKNSSRFFKIRFYYANVVVDNFIKKAIIQLDMENQENSQSLYQIFSDAVFNHLCKISSNSATLNELVVYKKIETNDYSRKKRRLVLKDCNVLFDFDNFKEFYLTGKTNNYETNIYIEQNVEMPKVPELAEIEEQEEPEEEATVLTSEPVLEPELDMELLNLGVDLIDDGFCDFDDLVQTCDDSLDNIDFVQMIQDVSNKNLYDINVREYLQCYQYDFSEEIKEAGESFNVPSLDSYTSSANMSIETSGIGPSTDTNNNEDSRFCEIISDLDLSHSNDFDALLEYVNDSDSLESQMFELNLV